MIYDKGEIIPRNIKKTIHYFTLAANQNCIFAFYHLGYIYSNEIFNSIDIEKAIHYYTLAAEQNHDVAQCNLGYIYI